MKNFQFKVGRSFFLLVSMVRAIDDHTSRTEQRSIGTVDFFVDSRILFGRVGTPLELIPPIFHIFGGHLKKDG
jgi:hypothetical protein